MSTGGRLKATPLKISKGTLAKIFGKLQNFKDFLQNLNFFSILKNFLIKY
jgi:hypothetical protein